MTRRPRSTTPCKPSQGSEVVGKRPAWELWAESQRNVENRGQQLLDAGAFTVGDLARKNDWTHDKAKHFLRRHNPPLKHEVANDPREYRNPQVRFYFPPGITPPPK